MVGTNEPANRGVGALRTPLFSTVEAVEFASIEQRARFENGLAKPVFEPMLLLIKAVEITDACPIARVDPSRPNIPAEHYRVTLGIGARHDADLVNSRLDAAACYNKKRTGILLKHSVQCDTGKVRD
jgi:hypothetical protein